MAERRRSGRRILAQAVIAPEDTAYDTERKVWNGDIDKYPAAIAQCAGAADVVAAIGFAREQGLPVAVRGGGHSVAGNAISDDGLMIDLSRMKGIRVDPARRVARAEPGLRWIEFDRETQAFGLATTGGTVGDTGIAGLTLGGGQGWLMGKHGATCDNLLSVDIVTADGQLRTASATENEDLFWAVRGGGGNFGVVTSFEYQLHQLGPIVFGGMILFPLPEAPRVLAFYREFTQTVPDELTLYAGLLTSPEGHLCIGLVACYAGPVEEGQRLCEPLRTCASPVADFLGPIPYTVQQTLLAAAAIPGRRYYSKSQALRDLDAKAIDTLVDQFSQVPSPFSLVIVEHLHGAYSRVRPDATAFAHRTSPYDLIIFSAWEDPAVAEANRSWARGLLAAMQPFAGDSVYVNEMSDDDRHRIRQAYGPNYDRLAAIKKKYDPTNCFARNQNIAPTG